MFDFVRKHTKVGMVVLFLLVIPSFVLLGVEGYSRNTEKGEAVATVAGSAITQAQWDAAHASEVERVRASMPNVDPKLLDSPQARYASLERLVRDRVLAAAATKSHLATSDARLARTLQENPEIAALRGADGRLDMERYRQLVGSRGMTPEMYEARVRVDLATRQLMDSLSASGFVTAAQADAALNAFFEKREIQVAMFDATDFKAKASVTDAELEAYYQANQSQFQLPEQAAIEYVLLDLDAVKASVAVDEKELREYYGQNAARLAGQEERQARHILITAAKDAPAGERDKARATAQELLAVVRKAPASFAEVAKKQSQDPGSATNGGDLGFFARGAMVKPFEDAAFAMKKGDISDVVESDFGFHIIQLAEIKMPKPSSFEEQRPALEAQVRQQQAQRKFAETAETFSNNVYEQPDSLKGVADKLQLPVKTATITRVPAPGATGPLANSKFLDAIFSGDAVEKKRNTEAIEVGPSQLLAGRVVQHTPARTLPLAEVRDRVREQLRAVQAADLARKDGQARLAQWKADPAAAVTGFSAASVVSRDQPEKQLPQVVDAALRAAMASAPAFAGVDLGAGGYAVVKVNKSVPRAAAADTAERDRAQVAQWATAAEARAYYDWLKGQMKVEIKAPRPATREIAGA